jgi:hypothetical protein
MKKQTNSEKAIKSRRRKSDRLKMERGGKCELCPYDRSLVALDWHHKDGEIKLLTIGNSLSYSYERLKAETEKCMLICSNCHRELHDK